MAKFSVRLASERDADLVWQLVLRTGGPLDRIGTDRAQIADQLRTEWTKIFLAESGHEAVGFCLAALAFDTWDGPYLAISSFFVEPEFRGRHLCTALVAAACRFARDELKVKMVDCTVPAANSDVAEILQSFGFYNLTEKERSVSFQLDSAGLTRVLESTLRAGIRLEGFGDVRNEASAAIAVRPCTATDANDVLRLIVELAGFQGFADNVILTAAGLAKHLESGLCTCVVAIETSQLRVIGMAVSWRFLTMEKGLMARLEDIFIAPQHRGQGVGRALLVGTCLWAKSQGAAAMDLRTQDWNVEAQAAYKAMGFEEDACKRPIIDFRIEDAPMDQLLARPGSERIAFCT